MTVTTVSLTLAAASGASAATVFGFQTPYAPINWTLTNSNADGFVDTTGAPASISLTGGENNSGSSGTTDYTTTAAAAGTVTFDWDYSTQDSLVDSDSFCSNLPNDFCDPFIVLVNGVGTIPLNPSGGTTQSGTSTFNVLAGDSFGFRIATADNFFGPGSVTISNFSAPAPIPEPSTVLSLLVLGGLGAGLKYLKRN
ncbi:MAG: PEP-CTERM sorting domain-containing protein [Microcystis wesenbergii Mw_MB_S_20031200_S109]|uniref:PEP-CTERM sorting domain-containing protein n=1 Tax=Microcystis wesenbergii Mw_MB_S_20031200_S109D TaxID=2486241 RepID=A0A552M026_9CHRO|nr:MAG: PEP-CTERM sorting domain-containing protein [Microcystis wesenbergii Mw_MB_S_20031200_S109]TRV25820.1 MAG: PEP-CTERM sorting domain-containing protein [Microcystis wesenbergii Mw_MB_S_20031200_S109D]